MERELLLLGLLRQEQMHGYQLHDIIESYLDTCVDLKKPTAYYLLDKMAQEGLVSQSEDRVGNRPRRRVYRLTPAGEARFRELLHDNLASYLPAVFGSMVGLAFLDQVDPAEAGRLLHQRRERLAAALEKARAAPPHPGSMQYVINHQVAHLEAELAWLDSVLAGLPASAPQP